MAHPEADCIALCGFTLIIDDIVTHAGQTYMQQLGGGGPQTLCGHQLVSHCLQRPRHRLGLAAGVGLDMPPACTAWLQELNVDVSGLIPSQLPTPRAWQLFEADGTRTQVWRVPECDALYGQLLPTWEALPPQLQRARSFHLGVHAAHPPLKLLTALRAAAHAQGGRLSVETYTCCETPPPEAQLRQLLALTDIFSPNLSEAASIVGPGSPEQLLGALMACGAACVVLRMGEDGVLIAERQRQQQQQQGPDGGQGGYASWHVPAVPDTLVVDVTGCGNACCGGLLAGLDAGLTVAEAGAWGCVAGSLMAEHQGVPPADVQQLVPRALAKHERLVASRPGWPRRGSHVAPVAFCSRRGERTLRSSVRRLQPSQGRGVQHAAACGPRGAGARVAVRWL